MVRNMLLAGAASILACTAAWAGFPEQTRTLHVAHAAGKPIDVRAHSGSIEIRAGGKGDRVRIIATVRSATEQRLAKITVRAERDQTGLLVLAADWPDGKPQPADAVSFDVTLPDAAGVSAITDNGAITISGLAGAATLETSNGAIEIRGHQGPVNAVTSNGRIKAIEVSGNLDVKTVNAAMELLDIGGAIRGETSNGAVTISTTDANPGPVRMGTANGAITLEVGSGFAGELNAMTSLGSLTLNLPSTVKIVEQTAKAARVRFAATGEKSTVASRNGPVTVRVRPGSTRPVERTDPPSPSPAAEP